MAGVLRAIRRLVTPKPLDPATMSVDGRDLAVVFRRHAQARRLVLRLNSDGSGVIVTVPNGVSRDRARDFAERSRDWIRQHAAARGDTVTLSPGSLIPLRGVDHRIEHLAVRRGTVTVDPLAAVIRVPGDLPHVPRRTLDWLKTAARADLAAAVERYARAMDVTCRRITVRDQRSRWGSCSAGGDLSFSWRLILTPDYVLDYVAAHEVAHLRHMDHSPRFWRLVLTHCAHAQKAKTWLKAHGQSVHRISV